MGGKNSRRTAFKMDVVLEDNEGQVMVNYTCPDCGYRNKHLWFGREKHWCNICDRVTDVKGTQVV